MIIDLPKFLAAERPVWDELEIFLNRLEADPHRALPLEQARRLHYLYERTAADLAKLNTFASEPDTRSFLESLVARAYGELHETRERPHRLRPLRWFMVEFPQAFRRHLGVFWLTVAITLAGCAFGGFATLLDPESRHVTMAFGHDQQTPSQRVAKEERAKHDRLEGRKGAFSAFLMTHNTKVSILTLALGMTWGVGTILELFYNGVILGAICTDYVMDGQGKFLAGWLLPHGSFEIPAILIAGQAGLLLGRALIGRGSRKNLAERLREISGDLVTLIGGVAVLLVWAGFVEAFFSQYHEPVVPYAMKIGFGLVELSLLILFLWKSGRRAVTTSEVDA
ncbi:MAG: hypothetical protein RL380_205 [Verrucomicrobiota bacterium]|jgi:uncharacterized membrane protein SpoIIM required for sporulation